MNLYKYIPIRTSANSESTNINTVYTCISQTLFYTVVGSVPSVPSNKTTAGFQKGGLPMRILKPPVPFPTPIKLKVKTIGPLGSCFRSLFSGDKTSPGFQKGRFQVRILKPPVPFPTQIKWKVKTMGPPSESAPQSSSGG